MQGPCLQPSHPFVTYLRCVIACLLCVRYPLGCGCVSHVRHSCHVQYTCAVHGSWALDTATMLLFLAPLCCMMAGMLRCCMTCRPCMHFTSSVLRQHKLISAVGWLCCGQHMHSQVCCHIGPESLCVCMLLLCRAGSCNGASFCCLSGTRPAVCALLTLSDACMALTCL